LPNEKKESAIAFLKATIAYYERLGIKIERIMTDNGSCYRSKAFKKALKAFGLRQIFTRPYTPKTNVEAPQLTDRHLVNPAKVADWAEFLADGMENSAGNVPAHLKDLREVAGRLRNYAMQLVNIVKLPEDPE
jgi:transposase InsO family protein